MLYNILLEALQKVKQEGICHLNPILHGLRNPTEKFIGAPKKRSDFGKNALNRPFWPFFDPKNGSGAKNWRFRANFFALAYVLS